MGKGQGGGLRPTIKGEHPVLLAKTTNVDTGAQSEEFILCAKCYGKLDDAITHANAATGTDIALCEVSDDVQGVCEQCGTD